MNITRTNSTILILDDQTVNAMYHFKQLHKLPESLLKAIRHVETRGDDLGFRYEPHLYRRAWVKRVLEANPWVDKGDEKTFCSMGPWQILYLTAVHNGFKGKPMELLDPWTNCKYACIYIDKLRKRFLEKETWFTDLIAAYNAGGCYYYDLDGNKKFEPAKGEQYKNQAYVNKVIKKYRALLKKQGIVSIHENLFKIFLDGG